MRLCQQATSPRDEEVKVARFLAWSRFERIESRRIKRLAVPELDDASLTRLTRLGSHQNLREPMRFMHPRGACNGTCRKLFRSRSRLFLIIAIFELLLRIATLSQRIVLASRLLARVWFEPSRCPRMHSSASRHRIAKIIVRPAPMRKHRN